MRILYNTADVKLIMSNKCNAVIHLFATISPGAPIYASTTNRECKHSLATLKLGRSDLEKFPMRFYSYECSDRPKDRSRNEYYKIFVHDCIQSIYHVIRLFIT